MSTPQRTERSARSREFRFGLVMYGGVSLAIYINGVAHELFRAVRGRGTYRLLKALTDSEIVVDILSGTSAGGINGILLAYALANDCEFGCTDKLWREHADVGALLRKLDRPLAEYGSLLDSEGYYHTQLQAAFDELLRNRIGERARHTDDPSACDELDLFVTGTDFHGRVWTTTDDAGHPVQVKDHRTVFWLKHRRGRKEPFSICAGDRDQPGADSTEGHATLATLARITSCFPAAFAPVKLGAESTIERKLRFWGQIPGDDARVLIDGGVLDNKPFTSALQAIYSRLADRPVERCLLYVEPDPETFRSSPETSELPTVPLTVLQSLTVIPSYESIADDLRSLAQHNDNVRRINRLIEHLSDANDPGYGENGYRRLRLAGLCERMFASMFVRHGATRPHEPTVQRARSKLRQWYMRNVVTDEVSQRYLSLDIDFFLRRLMHVLHTGRGVLTTPAERSRLRALNRQIQLLEILRSGMESAIESSSTDWLQSSPREPDDAWAEKVWIQAGDCLAYVCAVPPPPSYAHQQTLDYDRLLAADELRDFDARVRNALHARELATGRDMLACAQEFELQLFCDQPDLQQEYASFERIDRIVHPIEVVAGIRERDVIEIERISPIDARGGLSDRAAVDKVCGQRLGHFGAFFKRSWRSNDVLWGRLDAAAQLVPRLLGQRSGYAALRASIDDDGTRRALAALVAQLEQDSSALPLPADRRAALFEWLIALSDELPARRTAALERLEAAPGPDHPCELLVLAAQHEILRDGLESVFVDAAHEQLTWNTYRMPVTKPEPPRLRLDVENLSFVTGDTTLEPATVALAVAAISGEAAAQLRAEPERAARYFADRYRVGSETLDSLPRLVLLDLLVRTLSVTRNCLLFAMGDRAKSVQSHLLYRIFLGWPLSALAALSATLRRAPRHQHTFVVSAVLYIALSCVIVLFWYSPVIYDQGRLQLTGALVFIGAPALLAAALRVVMVSRDRPTRPWRKVASALFGVLAVAICLPALVDLFAADAVEHCRQLAQHTRAYRPNLPSWLGLAGVCHRGAVLPTLIELGRWIVLIAALLGAGSIAALLQRLRTPKGMDR